MEQAAAADTGAHDHHKEPERREQLQEVAQGPTLSKEGVATEATERLLQQTLAEETVLVETTKETAKAATVPRAVKKPETPETTQSEQPKIQQALSSVVMGKDKTEPKSEAGQAEIFTESHQQLVNEAMPTEAPTPLSAASTFSESEAAVDAANEEPEVDFSEMIRLLMSPNAQFDTQPDLPVEEQLEHSEWLEEIYGIPKQSEVSASSSESTEDSPVVRTLEQIVESLDAIEEEREPTARLLVEEVLLVVQELRAEAAAEEIVSTADQEAKEAELKASIQKLFDYLGIEADEVQLESFARLFLTHETVKTQLMAYNSGQSRLDDEGTRERKPAYVRMLSSILAVLKQIPPYLSLGRFILKYLQGREAAYPALSVSASL